MAADCELNYLVHLSTLVLTSLGLLISRIIQEELVLLLKGTFVYLFAAAQRLYIWKLQYI